jgi:serine/threonine-protein kinase RsbT
MRHRNHTNSPFMASLRKSFFIKARDFAHAGEASIHIQNLLKSMHLDSALVRRIAICCYEGEMNAVIHGGDANIHVDIETDHLTLEIADDGPGIEDIARAMQPGYSTASEEAREMGFGAGMGLPNMKNNSDDIRIECAPGQGTRVHMMFLYEAEREVA